jgi:hypothetical protein
MISVSFRPAPLSVVFRTPYPGGGLTDFRAVTTRSIFVSLPEREGVSEDFRGLGGSGPGRAAGRTFGSPLGVGN